MSVIKKYIPITLTTGGTINIRHDDRTEVYVVTGTKTLSSPLSITPTGVFTAGHVVKIFYNGVLTLSGNTLTILGLEVPETLVSKRFVVDAQWDGSAWITSILPDFSQDDILPALSIPDNSITTAKIVNSAVTKEKIEILAKGDILTSDGVANVVINGTEAQIPITQADGSLAFKSLSGDATIDEDGVVTIPTPNNSLQLAWDGGNTIVIANADNKPVVITNNDSTNNAPSMQMINFSGGYNTYEVLSTTSKGRYVNAVAEATTAAHIDSLNVYVNSVSHTTSEKNITVTGALSAGEILKGSYTQITATPASASTSSIYGDDIFINVASASLSQIYGRRTKIAGTQNPATAGYYDGIFADYIELDLATSSTNARNYGVYIDLTNYTSTYGRLYGYSFVGGSASSTPTLDYIKGVDIDVDFILNGNGYAYGVDCRIYNTTALGSSSSLYGANISATSGGSDPSTATIVGVSSVIVSNNTSATTYSYISSNTCTHIANIKRGYYCFDSGTLNGAAVEYYGFDFNGASINNTLSLSAYGARLTNFANLDAGMLIKTSESSSNDSIGIEFNISNGGAGAEYAFKFTGNELVNAAIGGAQDYKVRVKMGSTDYYIPLYTA